MSSLPGHISATAVVSPPGMRARVRISRPPAVARAFVGQPAADMPQISNRLFALCGAAHAAAARLALEQAGGPDAGARGSLAEAVLRERVAGGLRDFALTFAAGGTTGKDAAMLRSLHGKPGPAQFAATAAALLPRCRQWAQAMRQACSGGSPASAPDPLTPSDDAAVAEALAAAPLSFMETPALGARRVETGPFARRRKAPPQGELAARLDARLAALEDAVRGLDAPEAACLFAAGSTGRREGWSAVEIGRGRLHHVVALDAAGRIAAYGIVTPTDWNFRPDGPFERSLNRLEGHGRDDIERRARLLAGLLDPCMPFHIDIRETANA